MLDRRAVALAGHTGDETTARSALGHHDAAVRATALGALERLGVLTDSELAVALGDPAVVVRRRAAELAARHPDVDLLLALADHDASVVEAAAWACGEAETASTEVLDALIALTGHDDALVRESAVAALGARGDDRGLDAVLAGTADQPAVRRRAVLALAPFTAPDHQRAAEVRAALDRALTDRDWQVRQAAEDLGRWETEAVARPSDEDLVRQACAVAAEARDAGNHPFGALLVDPDGEVLLAAQNTVVTNSDATGHAETNLVRLASARHDRRFLADCTMVASTEPCAMCAGAIYWSGIGRVVYGLAESALAELTGADPDNPTLALPCRDVFDRGERTVEVVGPIDLPEVHDVHRNFWDRDRQRS